ncbi:hypothetical protein VTL71DRAFT_4969 [Oculimacula yallundae]|uniref:2EXR domain-containing protein n=1 Tax=Oculimacula yallundae TaxID=86028 RepID=A0ABR4C3I9_9HELO
MLPSSVVLRRHIFPPKRLIISKHYISQNHLRSQKSKDGRTRRHSHSDTNSSPSVSSSLYTTQHIAIISTVVLFLAMASPSDPSSTSNQQKMTASAFEMQLATSSGVTSISSVNDAATLETLANLPDFYQLLYLQLGADLKAFNCFGKLPLELRLMVWRLAFPRGRYVNFNDKIRLCMGLEDPDSTRTRGTESHCPLLATLHTNQESRNETLKHYSVMLRPNTSYYQGIRPLYYNPVLDTVFLSPQDGIESLNAVSQLQYAAPKLFGLIETLEIRSWMIRLEVALYSVPGIAPNSVLYERLRIICRFPGLKHLKIIQAPPKSGFIPSIDPTTDSAKQQVIGLIRGCLDHCGAWTVTPTVSVQPWSGVR